MIILCERNSYCITAVQALLQNNNNEFSDPIYCWAADSWDVEQCVCGKIEGLDSGRLCPDFGIVARNHPSLSRISKRGRGGVSHLLGIVLNSDMDNMLRL